MPAFIANLTSIAYNVSLSGSPVDIVNAKGIQAPEQKSPDIETSDLNTEDSTFVCGSGDNQTFSFELLWEPATVTLISTLYQETFYWTITLANSNTITFSGYINNIKPSESKRNELQTVMFTGKVSGDVTYGAG
jgi:hypothetical protein